MPEKKILIVDSEILRKIDENRGDMSRSDFIGALIDNQLGEQSINNDGVSKQEFEQFAQGIKELLRNFLEFFISYGVELGSQPKGHTFEELTKKLQMLDKGHK